MRRIALTCAALLVAVVTLSAAPTSILGLESWRWKQRGSTPIVLTFYDATEDPAWAPVIQEATRLWDASPAFDLRYARIEEAPDDAPDFWWNGSGNIYVSDKPGQVVSHIVAAKQGFIEFASISLGGPSTNFGPLSIPPGWTLAEIMLDYIGHEEGHVLGLAHHANPLEVFGSENWLCVMGYGKTVGTEFDLALLCQRYRC